MSRRVRCLIPGLLPVLAVLLTGGGRGAPDGTVSGRATLRGRVTLDGPAPDVAKLNQDLRRMMEQKDKDHCLKGGPEETEQQSWRIDAKGGVANVVVWLRPPEGRSFALDGTDLDPKTRSWSAEVVLDTPHCAFVPHVLVLFPSYPDPRTGAQRPTGQKLRVKNSAAIAHNASWFGENQRGGDSALYPPGAEKVLELKPARLPVIFQCNIHPWMKAYAWVFDHPFAAVTRKDGTYEIKNVPAGTDLHLMAWHEETGYLNGKEGDAVHLKEGEHVRDFKVRVK